MKSRVIVWTIVGLVAIAGLVFVVATPARQRSPKLTVDRLHAEASQMETQIERAARRIDAARKAVPASDAESNISKLEARLDETRQAVASVREATEVKKAEEQLRTARQLMRSLRRDIETAFRDKTRVPTL